MSDAPGDGHEEMEEAVRRYRARRARRDQEGAWTLARTVALVRSLGWMIALPVVAGVFAGRWLDTRSGGGILWTVALLCAGLGVGCWLAWNKVAKE